MADQDAGTGIVVGGGDKGAAGGGGEDFKAMLEAERAARTRAERERDEFKQTASGWQRTAQQRGHENLQLQKQMRRGARPAPVEQWGGDGRNVDDDAGTAGGWSDEERQPAVRSGRRGGGDDGDTARQEAEAARQTRLDVLEQRQAISDFRMENPTDWQEILPEVNKIMNDPVLLDEIGTFRRDGSINWQASLKNAEREVLARRYRDNRQSTAAARATAETQRQEAGRRAQLSGGGSFEADQAILDQDRSQWTPEDYISKGAVHFDAADPSRVVAPRMAARRRAQARRTGSGTAGA